MHKKASKNPNHSFGHYILSIDSYIAEKQSDSLPHFAFKIPTLISMKVTQNKVSILISLVLMKVESTFTRGQIRLMQ